MVTATPEATTTATPEATATATVEPTITATPEVTATATPEATATGTATPTPAPLLQAAAVVALAPTPTPSGPIHADGGRYSPTTDSCAMCHRTHGAGGSSLRTAATQEQTCYTCHNGTGGPNIQAQFSKMSAHPVGRTPEVHRVGESAASSFSGANRHVECVDCHDPHSVGKGNHTPGTSWAGGTLQGTWGIDVANGPAWTTPSLTRVSQVSTEYQLCFKCHSSWAYGSSPPTSHSGGIVETNQAVEFNVNNVSYHWVEGDKTATSGVTPRTADGRQMAFVAGSGWTATSAMTCTDCHASNVATEPRGPHGSANAYLLKGTWGTGAGSNTLCTQCHNMSGATSFSNGSENYHNLHVSSEGYGCMECHSAVPHGGQFRALLAPRSVNGLTQPTTDYNRNSRLTINGAMPASGTWRESSCSGCH